MPIYNLAYWSQNRPWISWTPQANSHLLQMTTYKINTPAPANHLLYMPLDGDVLDYSENHNNWTWSSWWTYWLLGESSNKQCAYISWNQINLATCPVWTGNPWAFTHACWVKTNNAGYSVLHHFGVDSYASRSMPVIFYSSNHYPINDTYGVDISLWGNASSSLYGSRMRVVYTYDGQGWHQLYINGSLYGTGSWTLNIGNGSFSIWINNSTYKEFWLSECIIDDYVWSSTEVTNDYNSSKWDYTELPYIWTPPNITHIATNLTNFTDKASVLAEWWSDITNYNRTSWTLANWNWLEITSGSNAVVSLCYELSRKLKTTNTLTLRITGNIGNQNDWMTLNCGLMNAKGDGTYTWARADNKEDYTWIRINGSLSSLWDSRWDIDMTVTMNFSTWVITLNGTATWGVTTISQTSTMTAEQIQTTLGYGYIIFQLVSIYGRNCTITSAEYTIN